MKPLKSSNLSEVDYDAGRKRLTIKFKNGRSYHYDNVSSNIYDGLLTAESAGKFFYSRINGKFGFGEDK